MCKFQILKSLIDSDPGKVQRRCPTEWTARRLLNSHHVDYASRIAGIAIERDRSQTALTRAFEQIEKSEAQLRHIVDAIPQMIAVLNPDGTVLYMNQTMLDYMGLIIEEVMAKNVRDRAFNPEDVARFRCERMESLSRGVHFKTKNESCAKMRTTGGFSFNTIRC